MTEKMNSKEEVRKDLDRIRELSIPTFEQFSTEAREWHSRPESMKFNSLLINSIADYYGHNSNYWISLSFEIGSENNETLDMLCLLIALSIIENPQKRNDLQEIISKLDYEHKHFISNGLKSVDGYFQYHQMFMQYHDKFRLISDKSMGNPNKSDCFVATATYGSPNHETVVLLRRFRDKVLTNYRIGRLFISAYWIVGPHLARFVNRYPLTKKIIAPMLESVARCVTKSN